jgi:hypothetical protein
MDHEQPDHRLAAPHSPNGDDVYQDLRPLLFSIACRMVGSYSEEEDLVQEAFVRFHEAALRGRGDRVDQGVPDHGDHPAGGRGVTGRTRR